MSDFDKEAEREKLREKYERDQENREVAEKMSELLLQGATMTNAHCSECGDPIFRYDGQEFCATCERAVDRDGDDAAEADSEDDETADDENIEVTSPDDTQVKFGPDEAGEEAEGESAPDQTRAPDQRASAETGQTSAEHRETASSESRQEAPASDARTERTVDAGAGQPDAAEEPPEASADAPRSAPETRQRVPSVEPSEQGDVTAARESLVRTLTRFSQQAETAEDPQRAREYLAAAREAAEALSALRR